MKAWTKQHREWIKSEVHFDQPALEATLANYLEEVDHVWDRIVKLEKDSYQPAVEHEPRTDELNFYPWYDLTCGTCCYVIATLLDDKPIEPSAAVTDEPVQPS
jgi:hypothetical protein